MRSGVRVLLGELYKAVCSRTVWMLLGVESVVVCSFSLAVGVPGLQAVVMIAVLLGVYLMAAEYPSRTIWLTVVAARSRRGLFAAQVCSLALLMAVPVVLVMLILVGVDNPYLHFDGTPYSVGEALILTVRMAVAVIVTGMLGGFLGAGMRSTTAAMVAIILVVGVGQALLAIVPLIVTRGRVSYVLPEWINAALPNSVLTRLLGGDFAAGGPWWDGPAMAVVEALAWVCPVAAWAYWRVVRADL